MKGIYSAAFNCNNDSDDPDDYCCGIYTTYDLPDCPVSFNHRCPKHAHLSKSPPLQYDPIHQLHGVPLANKLKPHLTFGYNKIRLRNSSIEKDE